MSKIMGLNTVKFYLKISNSSLIIKARDKVSLKTALIETHPLVRYFDSAKTALVVTEKSSFHLSLMTDRALNDIKSSF